MVTPPLKNLCWCPSSPTMKVISGSPSQIIASKTPKSTIFNRGYKRKYSIWAQAPESQISNKDYKGKCSIWAQAPKSAISNKDYKGKCSIWSQAPKLRILGTAEARFDAKSDECLS